MICKVIQKLRTSIAKHLPLLLAIAETFLEGTPPGGLVSGILDRPLIQIQQLNVTGDSRLQYDSLMY